MPYTDVEWAVILTGALPGNEVWANRWTVIETDPASDVADCTTPFRTFYTAWSQICDNAWTVTSIAFRNLVNGTVVQPSWALLAGDDTVNNPLPPEVAVRVSITGAGNVHGGPFLAGLAVPSVDSNGQFVDADADAMTNALGTLMADLVAVDFALRLDSPSTTSTKAVEAVRLGRTFDVIRRRRNKIPELYSSATVVP